MFKLADYTINQVSTNAASYMHADSLGIIKAQQMWQFVTGKGVLTAIIDTGVDKGHPALKDKVIDGYSFVPGQHPGNYGDENGHGTHVAGIHGLIAPDAKILALKALDKRGNANLQTIVSAIDYASSYRDKDGRRVDIINLSLGAPQNDQRLHDAIKRAVKRGVLVCCAAGNEGDGNSKTTELSYPAMYPEVVSVGAVDFSLGVARFSNSNNQVDLAAPGSNIWSTLPVGRYGSMSGTSMASPHVAGMAALYIEKYGKRFDIKPTGTELFLALKMMSKDIGFVGIDADTGAGLVMAWL